MDQDEIRVIDEHWGETYTQHYTTDFIPFKYNNTKTNSYQHLSSLLIRNISYDNNNYNNNDATDGASKHDIFVHIWERILNDYTIYHEKFVNDIEDYNEIEYNSTPYIQWTCKDYEPSHNGWSFISNRGCGGLGDRLSGLFQTFYMALCMKRIFLIDWDSLPNYLTEHSISWNIQPIASPFVHYSNTIDNFWSEYFSDLRTIPATKIRMACNLWVSKNPAHCPIWNQYYIEYLTTTTTTTTDSTSFIMMNGSDPMEYIYDDNEIFEFMNTTWRRLVFQYLFAWSEQVKRTTDVMRQEANLSTPYIVSHIRTGGQSLAWKTDPDRHSNTEDWDRFYNCSMYVNEQHQMPNSSGKELSSPITQQQQQHVQQQNTSDDLSINNKLMDIYVASDNPLVKEYMQQHDRTGHIRTLSNLTIFHVDRSDSVMQNQYNMNSNRHIDDDDDDGELIAWAELKLLIDAECIIMSNSQFSINTAVLSKSSCALYFYRCTRWDHHDQYRTNYN